MSAEQTPCSPPEPNAGAKARGEPQKRTSPPPPKLVCSWRGANWGARRGEPLRRP